MSTKADNIYPTISKNVIKMFLEPVNKNELTLTANPTLK